MTVHNVIVYSRLRVERGMLLIEQLFVVRFVLGEKQGRFGSRVQPPIISWAANGSNRTGTSNTAIGSAAFFAATSFWLRFFKDVPARPSGVVVLSLPVALWMERRWQT